MILTKKNLSFLFFITFVLMISCIDSRKSKLGVELAMKRYDNLILKLDADSISMSFTPDGNLGNIAIGRDSIKKFLLSFKNIRVLSQASITSTLDLVGDSATQKGIYYQTALVSEKDTVKVKGEYTANWQWITYKGWFIKRMITKPIK
ncbi:MAG: hypothetical protein HXX16_20295 [Bacteroidales bacterium]|nr:hypothetical protein [Bacteroidales bacterium]